MNHWHNDYMAEYHRQDLIDDSERVRLASLAKQSRVHAPGLFTRTMHNLAAWMISTGKELHERYELPNAHSHKRSRSFAH